MEAKIRERRRSFSRIGKWIHNYRVEEKLTLIEFAKILRISQKYLKELEQKEGNEPVRFRLLDRLYKVTGNADVYVIARRLPKKCYRLFKHPSVIRFMIELDRSDYREIKEFIDGFD